MMGKTDVTAPARLLAVEVLLAEPELLGNDALETDLYLLRDDLRTKVQATVAAGPYAGARGRQWRRHLRARYVPDRVATSGGV